MYCMYHYSAFWVAGDFAQPRCEAGGCHKIAYYGYPDGTAVFCRAHRLEDMVSRDPSVQCRQSRTVENCNALLVFMCHVKSARGHGTCENGSLLQENIRNPVCGKDGCHKQASYGYPGGRRVRCAPHRLNNMVGTQLFLDSVVPCLLRK